MEMRGPTCGRAARRSVYLLKDVGELAQNVLLQAVERGNAAGQRRENTFKSESVTLKIIFVCVGLGDLKGRGKATTCTIHSDIAVRVRFWP